MSFRTFTVRQTYITEATTGMVDISILNADKAFGKKPVEFFFQLDGQGNTISPREFIIEEKFMDRLTKADAARVCSPSWLQMTVLHRIIRFYLVLCA